VLSDLGNLAEIVAFLVAMMVLAQACADEGLFETLAARMALLARGSGSTLLAWSIGLAAAVTVALSSSATVVVLAPVLMAVSAVRSHRWSAYAAVRLANSGSTLLPVSNVTNLLVFAASGLSFVGFAWAMLPVWVVAIVAEYVVLRWWFRAELGEPYAVPSVPVYAVPLFPLAVVVVVLFALAGGTPPWIPATAGAMLVAGYALARRNTTWSDLLEAANLPLAGFVLVWAFAVTRLASTSAGDWVDDLLPGGAGLGALLATALIAMIASSVVNSLPATILLLPAAAAAGPEAVLALVVGVNIGANLTVIGSLANLQWRESDARGLSSVREFNLLGLFTTPAIVVLCCTVLWAWTSLIW